MNHLSEDLIGLNIIILVPYNTINWVHSDTGTPDQRARKKVHQVIRATLAWQGEVS